MTRWLQDQSLTWGDGKAGITAVAMAVPVPRAADEDDFARLDKELVTAQRAEADSTEQVGMAQAGPARTPHEPKDVDPASRWPENGSGPVLVEHKGNPPRWPFAFAAFGALALVGLLRRQDNSVIKDYQDFIDALRLWSPWITSDPILAAPREVKRFRNKARYFAMRLRQPREQRSALARWLSPTDDTGPGVGKPAIRAADTGWLRRLRRRPAAPPNELARAANREPRDDRSGLRSPRAQGERFRADVQRAFRALASAPHPDPGGSEAAFKDLNANYQRALKLARDGLGAARFVCSGA